MQQHLSQSAFRHHKEKNMDTRFFLTWAFIGLFVGTCIGYIVALTREESWGLRVKPQRMESFSTMFSPEESLAAIICFAQASGYKISNLDETKKQVLLEEPISLDLLQIRKS
jgi:hypothetical protein